MFGVSQYINESKLVEINNSCVLNVAAEVNKNILELNIALAITLPFSCSS